MIRKACVELVVLVVCLSVFPAAVIGLLIHSNSLHLGFAYLNREISSGDWSLDGALVHLLIKWLVPYAVVQGIRAYLWSGKSVNGRVWASIYFAALSGAAGLWFLAKAADTLLFMYALGDLPAELGQFFQLEYLNVISGAACALFSTHFVRVALDPEKMTGSNGAVRARESDKDDIS